MIFWYFVFGVGASGRGASHKFRKGMPRGGRGVTGRGENGWDRRPVPIVFQLGVAPGTRGDTLTDPGPPVPARFAFILSGCAG